MKKAISHERDLTGCSSFGGRPARGAMVAAFSLVEILVVIVLVATLLGIFVPLAGKMSQRSQEVRCLSNLRQLGLAVFIYAGEHQSRLPPAQEEGVLWFNLNSSWLGKYGKAAAADMAPMLRCPLDKTGPPVSDYRYYYSYSWNSHYLQVHVDGKPAYGRRFAVLAEAGRKILWVDGLTHADAPSKVSKYPGALTAKNAAQRISHRHRGGVQALFGDGRTVWLSREEAIEPALYERELDAL